MIQTKLFIFLSVESKVLVTHSCLTLCDPMYCSPSGSSVHEILQAGILEWVAIHFSRGSSGPRDGPRVSCIAGRFFPIWAPREALNNKTSSPHIPAGTISGASRTSEHFHQPSLSFYLKNVLYHFL